MAQRFWSVVAGGMLAAVAGCIPSAPVSSVYRAPTFDPPKMLASAPPPVVAIAPPQAVVSQVPPVLRSPPVVAPPFVPRVAAALIGPAAWIPPVPSRPWRWIIVHHSDTTTGGALAFDKMHRAKGWDELGYDFVIGNGSDTGNGQIEVGPRWIKQKIGAHAKTSDNRYNEFGIGICLVGNFNEERPTAKQMESLDKLVAYLMVTYHIPPDHILGHRDTKPTECPGAMMSIPAVRRQASVLAGIGTTPASKPRGEMLVDVRSGR